jgi:hypothetical protein
MAGQTLRYVAELDGEWVAIASFSAAALNLTQECRVLRRSELKIPAQKALD